MTLDTWARDWAIPHQALADLKRRLYMEALSTSVPTFRGGEADVQSMVRLEASKKGIILWRNNVGVLQNAAGIPVRYGLANDSKQMNERVKSHDLIGIRPILIQSHMVGMTIGQFISRETKKPGWKWSGTDREKAQLKFAEIITSLGGDSAFANSLGTL